MIKQIEITDLNRCAEVIRESFATVAAEFGLTEQNCPKHTSFVKTEALRKQFDSGTLMLGYFENCEMVGYVSIHKADDNSYELNNLAVLPCCRHKGYGKELMDYCVIKVRELGGHKITIGIIEENTQLKDWYAAYGFIHTGTRKFDHLPFTVGFMEFEL